MKQYDGDILGIYPCYLQLAALTVVTLLYSGSWSGADLRG